MAKKWPLEEIFRGPAQMLFEAGGGESFRGWNTGLGRRRLQREMGALDPVGVLETHV